MVFFLGPMLKYVLLQGYLLLLGGIWVLPGLHCNLVHTPRLSCIFVWFIPWTRSKTCRRAEWIGLDRQTLHCFGQTTHLEHLLSFFHFLVHTTCDKKDPQKSERVRWRLLYVCMYVSCMYVMYVMYVCVCISMCVHVNMLNVDTKPQYRWSCRRSTPLFDASFYGAGIGPISGW